MKIMACVLLFVYVAILFVALFIVPELQAQWHNEEVQLLAVSSFLQNFWPWISLVVFGGLGAMFFASGERT